jgi:4-carboxymuconolactone decarboxylase
MPTGRCFSTLLGVGCARVGRDRRTLERGAVTEHERTLRCLAVNDQAFIESVVSGRLADSSPSGLDPKTQALVGLAALIALDAAPATYQWEAERAFAAGVTVDDIVDTLVAVAPLIGIARAVCVAPNLGIALGYDVEAALERLESDAT